MDESGPQLIERLYLQIEDLRKKNVKAIRAARGMQARIDCSETILASLLPSLLELLPRDVQARLAREVQRQFAHIADRYAEQSDAAIDEMVTTAVNRYLAAMPRAAAG